MEKNKNFIVRLFALLFVVLMLALAAMGAAIYQYAGQVVGSEFIRLNQASLRQLSSATATELTTFRNFAERLSVNGRLIELVSREGGDGKEARSILNDQFNEFIASRNNSNALLDVFLVGNHDLHLSVYNSGEFTIERLRADPRCAPLFDGTADYLLLPTVYNEQGSGVQIYTFQMIYTMRDLLTNVPCGFVVLDLSELTLFSQYRNFQQGGAVLAVVDGEGTIVSCKDKRSIGAFYGYTGQELLAKATPESVTGHSENGNIYLCERIPGTDWLLVERALSASVLAPLNKVGVMIFFIVALCGVAMLCAFVFAARRILGPVMNIKGKMEQVMGGDLSVRIKVERSDEFGRIEGAFNEMVAEIERLIEEVKQGEKQKRLAELDFLQAQINPHFIYNTLTSIRFMLEMGKMEQAGEMVFYFSKLLRQTLSRSTEFVTLKEELSTLESYVNLQQLRYQDAFAMVYEIEAETLEVRVPALVLQPIVENAIFHGVGKKFVHIRITARAEGERLALMVEDDGIGMSKKLQETVLQKDVQINRVGLRNVHDRIQLNYGREYGLTVSETEGGGATITFLLPLERGGEL